MKNKNLFFILAGLLVFSVSCKYAQDGSGVYYGTYSTLKEDTFDMYPVQDTTGNMKLTVTSQGDSRIDILAEPEGRPGIFIPDVVVNRTNSPFYNAVYGGSSYTYYHFSAVYGVQSYLQFEYSDNTTFTSYYHLDFFITL